VSERTLVLASQSPRRREILTAAGLTFTVRVTPVPEVRAEGEAPEVYVRRLALAKAEASWDIREPGADEIVLGADTVVVLGTDVLEKPVDVADARRMLKLLSGREHVVISGICLRHADGAVVDAVSTTVRFAALSDAEIESYANSGEPLDKAGAYAIQGLASKFVESIDGDFFNVVGLPISRVYRYLQSL
jgi:septum formation protein